MPRQRITPDRKMLKKVEDLAARGVSKERIAYACGMSAATLYNRQKDDDDFREAFKKGRARAEVAAADALWSLIEQGVPGPIIFYLKSRCGWKESQELDVKADVSSVSMRLEEMSSDQLMALAGISIEDSEVLDEGEVESKSTTSDSAMRLRVKAGGAE